MMPTFPRSPLSFRTAGFPRYGCKAGLSDGAFPDVTLLKSAPDMRVVTAGLHPPFVHRVIRTVVPLGVGPQTRQCTAMTWVHHDPRGPRSGPGYRVPVRHHLIDPIRPTRGHIAISPHGGLYAMPSLCGSAEATRARFRAFADHSILTCRPLRPRGVHHRYASRLADDDAVFATP